MNRRGKRAAAQAAQKAAAQKPADLPPSPPSPPSSSGSDRSSSSDEDRKDEKKGVRKMNRDALMTAVKESAEGVDNPSEVKREKALANLFRALDMYEELNGSVSAAMEMLTLGWGVQQGRAHVAVQKAIRDRLWKGLESFDDAKGKIREALEWRVLTREDVVRLTPIDVDAPIAVRIQVAIELMGTSSDTLPEGDRELQVLVRVCQALAESEFRTQLPQLRSQWTDNLKKEFCDKMRDIVSRHDDLLRGRASSSSTVAAPAVPAMQRVIGPCYNCNMLGHLAAQCPRPRRCRACGKEGHSEGGCAPPTPVADGTARGGGRRRRRGGGRGGAVATAVSSEKPVVETMFDYPQYSYSQLSFNVHFIDPSVRERMEANPLVVRVQVRGAPRRPALECVMLVDTGAIPSVVSKRFVTSVGASLRPSRTECIRGVGDTRTAIVGEATLAVRLGGREFAVTALVAETTLFDFLLGTRGMREQGVGPVQIELSADGGRVKVKGGAWVPAVGWTASATSSTGRRDEEVYVLRDDSAEWRTPTSSLYVPIEDAGVLHAEFELDAEDGLMWQEALEMLGYEELPAAVVTGQEAQVAEAVRAAQRAEGEASQGVPWTLPGLLPSPSIVPAGPALQGSDIEAFKAVQFGPDLAAATVDRLRALCADYRDVLGGSKGEGATLAPPMNKKKRAIKLTLYPNARLEDVAARFRRTSPEDAKMLEEFALRMEAEGRLRREQRAPATSLALVVKKDDNSRRVVVNFGPLNQQLMSNHYPLPRIDDTIARLAKGAFRSSYDLWLCFHQFGISAESVPLTATWFSPTMLMSWLVAPMGIKTIPAEVQGVMEADFNNESTVVYIDDILQHVGSEAEIEPAVRHVLSRCREQGWTLNARKCRIGFRELPMLGKLVGEGTIKPLPSHLDGIRNYGKPTTYRQLRAFNGMLTALSAHLPSAAATIRPLYAAAGGAKQGTVDWTAEMNSAYEAALALLTSPEVVVPFDESRPLLLLTDWSVEGGAGVFAHLANDESHFEVIESFSHANSGAERNYGAAEGEISMVRLALKQFPHLMLGRRVYWVTDALTMRSAFEAFKTSASPRIRRTVAELQHVEIAVIDTPGRKHCIADALSRNPSFALQAPQKEPDGGAVEQDDDEVVAVVALALRGHPDANADSAMPVLVSMFDPVSEEEADDVEAFRVRDAAKERKEETIERWRARQLDDQELDALRALANANDAILAAGGTLAVPDDAKSTEALMPRHDESGLLCVQPGGVGPLRVVVPAGCVTETVHALHAGAQHDGGGAAHWHARRVVSIARRWVWWRTMYQDIVRWCAQCATCQRRRMANSKAPANLGDSEAQRQPKRLEEWQLDLFELGGQWFFTAIELYSGLLAAAPVADRTSVSFLQAFEQTVVLPFGLPVRLWFDGGSEMKRHFAAFCTASGIETIEGQPYNPQSQARVERAHRTLKDAVAAAQVEGAKASVVSLVLRAAHEMNVAPNEQLDELSPHRLLHAVEPKPALAQFIKLPDGNASSPLAPLREQVRELSTMHAALAAQRERERAEKRARHEQAFERSHAPAVTLSVGDAVWAILPPVGVGSKLEQMQAWTGPWTVTAFDEQTGKVDMVYRADSDAPATASVHVRNTRAFSAMRPLDPPHLLDEAVFPKGWEKSSLPLGGDARLPKKVQAAIDEALDEAVRRAKRKADEEQQQEQAKQAEAAAQRARVATRRATAAEAARARAEAEAMAAEAKAKEAARRAKEAEERRAEEERERRAEEQARREAEEERQAAEQAKRDKRLAQELREKEEREEAERRKKWSFIGQSSALPMVELISWDAKTKTATVRRRITKRMDTIPESEIDSEPGLREQVEQMKKADEARQRRKS